MPASTWFTEGLKDYGGSWGKNDSPFGMSPADAYKFDYDKTGAFDIGAPAKPFGDSGSSGPKAVDYLKAFASNAFGGDEGKYRRKAEEEDAKVRFGQAIAGGSGRVLDNLGVVYPQQHAPIYIPGVQQGGSGGKGGKIGRLAGTALGLGASMLIPGVGPMIGASIGGSLGGGVGGLFD